MALCFCLEAAWRGKPNHVTFIRRCFMAIQTAVGCQLTHFEKLGRSEFQGMHNMPGKIKTRFCWGLFCVRYMTGLNGFIFIWLICTYSEWLPQCQSSNPEIYEYMMTSSNGNNFRVTGHLCGEFTGPRWIPHTKASDAELWCLLWSSPE